MRLEELQAAELNDYVEGLLKTQFRPEFLNRLDEIVFYKPLTREEIGGIVELQLADLRQRLAEKQLSLAVTDAAKATGVSLTAEEMAQLETLAKEANVDTRGSWENPMA